MKKTQDFKEGHYEKALEFTFFKMDEVIFLIILTNKHLIQMLETETGKKELQKIKSGDNTDNGDPFRGDSYAGCTANVALIHDKTIYVANAGDSRSCIGLTK